MIGGGQWLVHLGCELVLLELPKLDYNTHIHNLVVDFTWSDYSECVCVSFMLHWLGGGGWRPESRVVAPEVVDARIPGSGI